MIDGFEPAYLAGAAFALLAALALAAQPGVRATVLGLLRDTVDHGRWAALAPACVAVALFAPIAYAGIASAVAVPTRSRSPTLARTAICPTPAGITGFVQDTALETLDRVACKAGSSREELVLALVDPEEAERYQRRYGTDPRSVIDLAQLVLEADARG